MLFQRQQAIALIDNFHPFSGPLFETLEGAEIRMQQAEDYINGCSHLILHKAYQFIRRSYVLQSMQKFPNSRNDLKLALLEGAIIEYLESIGFDF